MRIVLFILFYFLVSSVNCQVIKTNNGYLLNKQDLSTLDFWARKGKACQENIDNNIILLEQIRMANLASDSITMEMQRNIFALKKNLAEFKTELDETLKQKSKVEADLDLTLEKNKRLKREKWLITGGGIATLIATVLILK